MFHALDFLLLWPCFHPPVQSLLDANPNVVPVDTPLEEERAAEPEPGSGGCWALRVADRSWGVKMVCRVRRGGFL